MPRLNDDQYAFIVRHTPLVSIDLILRDPEGAILLGYRNNRPAQGTWFVPGGVIRKDETIAKAFARVLQDETGLTLPFEQAVPLGGYQHFYADNRFDDPAYTTHYIVLAYRLDLAARPNIVTDDQHSETRWLTPAEILAMPDAHANTKAYFHEG